jgi:hypothetical protein
MVGVGQKDDPQRWKPDQFAHYLTMGELLAIVKRDRRRITQLESEGRLPAPIRVRVGRHSVRLYSPDEVAVVVRFFQNAKPGRPKKK